MPFRTPDEGISPCLACHFPNSNPKEMAIKFQRKRRAYSCPGTGLYMIVVTYYSGISNFCQGWIATVQ